MNFLLYIYHTFMALIVYTSYWLAITHFLYCACAKAILIFNPQIHWKGKKIYSADSKIFDSVIKERLILGLLFMATSIALTYHSTDILKFWWHASYLYN